MRCTSLPCKSYSTWLSKNLTTQLVGTRLLNGKRLDLVARTPGRTSVQEDSFLFSTSSISSNTIRGISTTWLSRQILWKTRIIRVTSYSPSSLSTSRHASCPTSTWTLRSKCQKFTREYSQGVAPLRLFVYWTPNQSRHFLSCMQRLSNSFSTDGINLWLKIQTNWRISISLSQML